MNTKKISFLFYLNILFILFYGCTDPTLSKNSTIVTTNEVTAITQNTAECGGEISSTTGIVVTSRGVCWSLNPDPTTSDSLTKVATESGKFICSIKNLIPDTTYYVRAYAINADVTVYGSQVIFKTQKAIQPSINTTKATNITNNSITSGGNITFNGGTAITERGVCWSTNPLPTILENKTSDGNGDGIFSSLLNGLTEGTTYYIRAYAINKTGIGYGNLEVVKTYTIPTVETTIINDITQTTAMSGGKITSDGGSSITARGVVWSKGEYPDISLSTKSTDGNGLSTFTSNILGLSENVTYYVRAYATNNFGTAYGAQLSFKSLKEIAYVNFTDQRDGNVYKTIQIGNQTWMAENLRYLPKVEGPFLGYTTSPFYYVYGYIGTSVSEAKATDNFKTYGVLYNWNAAIEAVPEGWHIPSDAEWTILENYLSDNGYNYDGTTGGGRDKISKAIASTSGWKSSTTQGAVGNIDYSIYRNKSGFNVLPGGYRHQTGSFVDLGNSCSLWSTNVLYEHSAWARYIYSNSKGLTRNNSSKDAGFSVRCIKN